MPGLEGEAGADINGPSLIRVPAWVEKPLGKYYLYFAHHLGTFIRMAYADKLEGPWKIYPGGVLNGEQGPGQDHIASPDVHIDEVTQTIRMYFHQVARVSSPLGKQVSFLAISKDGLAFSPREEALGKFYFRVFRYGGWYYAFAKNDNIDSVIYRSRDGLSGFEAGPSFLPGSRHTAMWVEGDVLYLLYTIVGEAPERIYLGTVDLRPNWQQWKVARLQVLLEPERDYEGVRLPLKPSNYGIAPGPLRELRDPAVYEENGQRYILWSVAGEQGIAIGKLCRLLK
ncbi:MAG: hypothetical protein EHM28_06055 [Spirochaetaceae bacterium]|nr:MAG: hypothetical protein EHM28_06055 [Spirochaetaceae bacterium]